MNVARVMGNSCDRQYVSALISAYPENDDERVQAMIVWALGKLGGASSIAALRQFAQDASGIVKAEIAWALASAAETDGKNFNPATGDARIRIRECFANLDFMDWG